MWHRTSHRTRAGAPRSPSAPIHHYSTAVLYIHAHAKCHRPIRRQHTTQYYASAQSTDRRAFTHTMAWARPRGASAEREGRRRRC